MSTTIESSRMSDMTPFQEAAAWVASALTAGVAAVPVWSKIMRSLSADKQAQNNDKTGQQLYDLLVNENKRVDTRNRELEEKNAEIMQRLGQLEIIHSKLMQTAKENEALRASYTTKDQQLTLLLQQQHTERQQFRATLKEYETKVMQLESQVQVLEANQLTHLPTGDRRIEDKLIPPQGQLNFEEHQ